MRNRIVAEKASEKSRTGRAGPLGPPKFPSTLAGSSGAPSGRALPSSTPSEKIPATYPEPAGAFWTLGEDPPKDRHAFDLEERTAVFGEAIVRFAKKIPRGPDNDRLIDQLVGCGTSIGANYCEANEGLSRKDFHCIIGRCRKESKETKYFLRMIAASEPALAPEARLLFREAKELHLIFCAMFRNSG